MLPPSRLLPVIVAILSLLGFAVVHIGSTGRAAAMADKPDADTDEPRYANKLREHGDYRLTRDARLARDGMLQGLRTDKPGPPQVDPGEHIVPRGTQFRIDDIVVEDRGSSHLLHFYGRFLDGELEGRRFDALMLHEDHYESVDPASTAPTTQGTSNHTDKRAPPTTTSTEKSRQETGN